MNDTVECPYCNYDVEMDIEHYKGYQEYQCPECKKNFEVLAQPTIEYSNCGKADCLNGGEHEWKPQVGLPKIYFKGRYVCKNCSAEGGKPEELATMEEWDEYFNDLQFKQDD